MESVQDIGGAPGGKIWTPRKYTVSKASALMGLWGVCFGIFGPPGIGKSTLAAQAVYSRYAGKVGVIDAEGGARAYGDRDDIDVFSIKDSDATHHNGMGYEAIEAVLDDLVGGRLRPQDADKYGTVIVDNCSEINAFCMYDTLRTYPRNIDRKDRPDQKDWNTTTNRMLLLSRRFRDYAQASGTNVIFILWDKTQDDKVTGYSKRDVAFNPALAGQFPGLIDMLGHLSFKGKDKLVLSFQASATSAAKFRRSPNETAMTIPAEFEYSFTSPHKPMADLLDCLKGGVAFPKDRYAQPKGTAVPRGGDGENGAGDGAKLSGADAVAAAIRGR